MQKFTTIQAKAEKRKGGERALKQLLPTVLSAKKLAQKSDDRFLAMMCKTVNQAGFNWSVIDKKWPQFEEAFYQFNINKLVSLSPEQWEAYLKDARVVRHWQKINALKENAYFVLQTAEEHGSFAKFIAQWPITDQIGLMAHLKKYGSRLGGQTGQWFLRFIGKDCFVTTQDVIAALQNAGCDIADNPTSKRDLTKIQNAFNQWHEESGLCFSHLSRIAAYSIGKNYNNSDIQDEIDKFNKPV
jgi:3-methyladenine DNA glycosylase Tag